MILPVDVASVRSVVTSAFTDLSRVTSYAFLPSNVAGSASHDPGRVRPFSVSTEDLRVGVGMFLTRHGKPAN